MAKHNVGPKNGMWKGGRSLASNGYYQGEPVRIRLADRAGGDMSEWPLDLRVREFPQSNPKERT